MDHLSHGREPELADSDTLLRQFVLANAHRSVELVRLTLWHRPPLS